MGKFGSVVILWWEEMLEILFFVIIMVYFEIVLEGSGEKVVLKINK